MWLNYHSFSSKFLHSRPKARKSNFSIRQKVFSLLSLSCKYWLQNSDPMCPFHHINFVQYFPIKHLRLAKPKIVFKFVCWVTQKLESRFFEEICKRVIYKLTFYCSIILCVLLFYQYSRILKQKSYMINIFLNNIWIKKIECKFGLSFKILKKVKLFLSTHSHICSKMISLAFIRYIWRWCLHENNKTL